MLPGSQPAAFVPAVHAAAGAHIPRTAAPATKYMSFTPVQLVLVPLAQAYGIARDPRHRIAISSLAHWQNLVRFQGVHDPLWPHHGLGISAWSQEQL
jgi:hypothetical protein